MDFVGIVLSDLVCGGVEFSHSEIHLGGGKVVEVSLRR